MRIGIDGHVLGKNVGGVERYVEKVVELVPDRCPQHQFVIFVSRTTLARYAADRRPNVRFVGLRVTDPIVQRSVVLPWAMRQHRIDVLHVQRIAPWMSGRTRILLTVHDLIPIEDPASYGSVRDRLVRLLTPGSIARASLIVCPSQTVCDTIARLYPSTRAPLVPYYNGVDRARFAPHVAADHGPLQRFALEGAPYVFSPGAIEARKDVPAIVEALALIEPSARPLLVLSGSIRDAVCYAGIIEQAERQGVRLRHLGFVSERELVALYGAAALCVAASRDEGFNLLPLEAIACGTPVLCSDIPVHRELFDGAVRFFPRGDAAALARGIAAGMDKGRLPVLPGADACLQRLSWEAMALRMAAAFDRL